MKNKLTAKTSITINAIPSKVWEALITPELIKKYLMGTNVISEWKEGSSITYQGEYEGNTYSDKGVIKKIEPEKILQSTYWSSMGGKEDKPENYNLVTYKLSPIDRNTVVSLTQNNIRSENEKKHVSKNWKIVLQKLKEVAEGH